MRIWLSLFILFSIFSCTQKWSEADLQELGKINQRLVENVNLSNQLTMSKFEFLVNQNGRRPADEEVLEEAKRVIRFVQENESLARIEEHTKIERYRLEELKEVFESRLGFGSSNSPLQKALLLEKVTNYYAQMVGGNCICFDEPTVKLLRSLADSSKYRVLAGGSLPSRELAIIQKDQHLLEVVDPFLIKSKMSVEWELVDSKKLIYNVLEE